jgi:hypothetical protein
LLTGPADTVTAYAGRNPEGSAYGVTPGNASGAQENAAGGPNNFPPNEPVVKDGDGNVHDSLDMGADGGAGDGGGDVQHDALNFEEEMAHLDGVDNQHEGDAQAADDGNAAEIQQVHQQQPVPPDPVFMLEAASPRQGVFPLLYAWDAAARAACNSPDYAAPPRLGNSCSNCGEVGHRRNHCAIPFYTMPIAPCKFCGTLLLGEEPSGIRCGKQNNSRLSFRRPSVDPALSDIYGGRRFLRYSMHINKLFAFVHGSAELRWSVPNMPSMLCVQGIDQNAMPHPNSSTSHLWSQGQAGLHPNQHSPFMHQALQNQDVEQFVPILYEHLRPPANIGRASYIAAFHVAHNNAQGNAGALNSAPTQGGHLAIGAAVGPVIDTGIPSEMEAISILSTGIAHLQAPLYGTQHIEANVNDGNGAHNYHEVYASSATAEKSLYPLLYPNDEQPWDLRTYELLRNALAGGGNPPSTAVRDATGAHTTIAGGGPLLTRSQGLTWLQHTKRRLYTDNYLLGFGPFFEMWLLHVKNTVKIGIT